MPPDSNNVRVAGAGPGKEATYSSLLSLKVMGSVCNSGLQTNRENTSVSCARDNRDV